MQLDRSRELKLDIWATVLLVPLALIPLVTNSALLFSLTHQIVIGLIAALAVYIMLRMDLLTFTVPAFMAFGGYAAAMVAKSGHTNLLTLMAVAFVVPAVMAIPLGALVLRLRGTYFIFVTFIFNEILQLVLFETPTLTGGSDGISGLPTASLFGIELFSQRNLVWVTVAIGIVAVLITLITTQRFRPEFAAIEENETLAESLGVAIWKYRTIGFVVSAGVSGLAGFALVNMLSTAHPSSFASFSVINYICYVFIGGRRTMLGTVIGTVLLVTMSNLFNARAEYSAGMFGALLLIVMMIAPGGLVDLGQRAFMRVRRQRRPDVLSSKSRTKIHEEKV